MPATGGTAAASSADVRRGAPLSVQGLERAVSLSDFTTFALNYAGVAKAEALAAESGGTTRVFLTLAGPDGRAVEGDVLEGLLAALLAASAPGTVCEAQSYELRLFAVHAAVRVDPRHQAPAVLDAARAALLSAFAFDQRHFAQGVAASAVTDAIQATPGVVAVDLDAFHPAGGSGVSAFLASLPARPAPGGTAPAQLLLIDPHDLRLLEWPA
jgi:hypothetical protein